MRSHAIALFIALTAASAGALRIPIRVGAPAQVTASWSRRGLLTQVASAAVLATPMMANAVAPPSPWHELPMFVDGARGGLTAEQRAQMDIDGHIVLPGIISEETSARAIAALARVDQIAADFAQGPSGASRPPRPRGRMRCWRCWRSKADSWRRRMK